MSNHSATPRTTTSESGTSRSQSTPKSEGRTRAQGSQPTTPEKRKLVRKMWIVCLWPGAARIWMRGDFSALIPAIGFGLLFNLALLSTFLWTDWLGGGLVWMIWPVVTATWCGSAIVTFLQLEKTHQLQMEPNEADDTLLIRAQTEYLKGNWSEVQSLVSRQLKKQPRDIPARLLLASLFRHLGNVKKAQQQLDMIERFDESVDWRFEIEREREYFSQMASESSEQEPQTSGDLDDQHVNNLQKDFVETAVEFIDGDQPEAQDRRAA